MSCKVRLTSGNMRNALNPLLVPPAGDTAARGGGHKRPPPPPSSFKAPTPLICLDKQPMGRPGVPEPVTVPSGGHAEEIRGTGSPPEEFKHEMTGYLRKAVTDCK